MSLLEISDLTVGYGDRHTPPVLDGVALDVQPGEILGVIGETGSGKTTLARTIVGLVPARSGRIEFNGVELSALRGRALRGFRRRGEVQFVFQDPLRALDPDLTAAESVAEPLEAAGLGAGPSVPNAPRRPSKPSASTWPRSATASPAGSPAASASACCWPAP
jgi:ABC-type glutathione transport system ATPase component